MIAYEFHVIYVSSMVNMIEFPVIAFAFVYIQIAMFI